jgi:hypothetical protein
MLFEINLQRTENYFFEDKKFLPLHLFTHYFKLIKLYRLWHKKECADTHIIIGKSV